MYNQFFSGDTATQIVGSIPAEITPDMYRNYLLDKALGKDVSGIIEPMKEYEKLIKSKIASPVKPLLELDIEVTPEEVSEPEISQISSIVLKKHSLNIYPEMDEEDYSALKNDIQKNGYDPKYPIWLYNGDILDGWNRHKVSTELNIEPVYKDFIGNDSDAIAFVIRSNNRRNLDSFQRACIATAYAPIFEKIKAEAKARQIEGGRNKVRQKIAQPNKDDNKTDEIVAKTFNTNRTYIQKARKIKIENPELFEKIKNGEEKIKKTNIKGIFSGENEWYTPPEYIEKVKRVMGRIDVDPASSDVAQKVVRAKKYYSLCSNGLRKKWKGNIFLNPPYPTEDVAAFIKKFIVEYNCGNIKQGIILTNNFTNTDWFHKLMKIAQLACFSDGRAKFYHQEKKPSIAYGHVFFYVGNDEDKFIKEFTDVGLIMRKA